MMLSAIQFHIKKGGVVMNARLEAIKRKVIDAGLVFHVCKTHATETFDDPSTHIQITGGVGGLWNYWPFSKEKMAQLEGGVCGLPNVLIEEVILRANGVDPMATERKACPKCDGCGRVANTDDEESWSQWASLPPGSNAAVVAGIVKPKLCDTCGGSGVLKNLSDPERKR